MPDPNLDIRFDGSSFNVRVPRDQIEDAKVRYEVGPVSLATLLEALCHYWIAEGGDVDKLRNFGAEEW